MRKLAIVLGTLILGACSVQPVAPNRNLKADSTLRKDGIPCTTEDGRSGYMVSLGDRCQAV